MNKDEALKLALEAIEEVHRTGDTQAFDTYYAKPAITAIKEALARGWVNLTDDEIKEIIGSWSDTPVKGYTRKLMDQIQDKLKEKNT
jgi:hypothetical protein